MDSRNANPSALSWPCWICPAPMTGFGKRTSCYASSRAESLSFIRWIWAFLRNRQFRVLFNGNLSRTRWLVHGVPQGAVLSPMLFLFYINSVADVIPKDVLNSIFADDLTIWANDHNKETAQWRVQEAVKHIESWCRRKKMLLSDKSVVTFFSAASCDSKWVPSLNMNNLPMKFDPTPKLLGLYMNRTLSFQQHVGICC